MRDGTVSCCCSGYQIPVLLFSSFKHVIFSTYTMAVLSHLRRRLHTYDAYHTYSEVTGLRGAKVGVSPPRRSPLCIYYIRPFFLLHRRNSYSGSHVRILMAGSSPTLPTTCYGLSWGQAVNFKRYAYSILTQSFISLFMSTGIYIACSYYYYQSFDIHAINSALGLSTMKSKVIEGSRSIRTHDRPKNPYTPSHTLIRPDHL